MGVQNNIHHNVSKIGSMYYYYAHPYFSTDYNQLEFNCLQWVILSSSSSKYFMPKFHKQHDMPQNGL